jgi:hypothetical protein
MACLHCIIPSHHTTLMFDISSRLETVVGFLRRHPRGKGWASPACVEAGDLSRVSQLSCLSSGVGSRGA